MNLANEIGNDVTRAFLVEKKCGDKVDASRAREIINAIRQTLTVPKAADNERSNGTLKRKAKAT